jgi:hypothetical protein
MYVYVCIDTCIHKCMHKCICIQFICIHNERVPFSHASACVYSMLRTCMYIHMCSQNACINVCACDLCACVLRLMQFKVTHMYVYVRIDTRVHKMYAYVHNMYTCICIRFMYISNVAHMYAHAHVFTKWIHQCMCMRFMCMCPAFDAIQCHAHVCICTYRHMCS